MVDTNLLFELPPTGGSVGTLVFGEEGPGDRAVANVAVALPGLAVSAAVAFSEGPPIYRVNAAIALPQLGVAVVIARVIPISAAITLPGLSPAVAGTYSTNVARPVVSQTSAAAQSALTLRSAAEDRSQVPTPTFASLRPSHTTTDRRSALTSDTNRSLEYRRGTSVTGQSRAEARKLTAASRHQEMLRDRRLGQTSRSAEAVRIEVGLMTSSQDRYRDRRPAVTSAHQAARPAGTGGTWRHDVAAPISRGWTSRHQEAMRPPPGYSPIVLPPTEVCYTPDPNLVFATAAVIEGTLLFICDNHDNPTGGSTIIVPVRRTYMVLNDIALRRVTGNIALPVTGMSINIDYASWTFGFSAGLPASAMQYLGREVDGSPALLEASVNGQTFQFLAESRARTRQFPKADFTVRGRGKSAILDSPYAPTRNFGSTSGRTLQQLMDHVLIENGVSLGWDVEFGITDWFVPANTWAFQGSYIGALNDIAAAAGAYLQPHPTDDRLRLLPLYPAAPWEWGTVSPDYVLPASVVQQEGVEWLDKPGYNAVIVAGTTADGISGNVTRAGTAGDLQAQMVTHPLITHPDAARQRGKAILADTGAQAKVSLRMPVLPATGIIMPGKFVSYVDGVESRFGITRAVDVQIAHAAVWQTLTVETRE